MIPRILGGLLGVGIGLLFNGWLYECKQAHTSPAGWTPDAVPSLWKANV